MHSETKTKEEIKEDCKKFVATINGLGSTLVMGHKAVYWDQYADMYAEKICSQEVAKARKETEIKVLEDIIGKLDNLNYYDPSITMQLRAMKYSLQCQITELKNE